MPAVHAEPAVHPVSVDWVRRRRWTVLVALIAGAVLVGATLRFPRGSAEFYLAGYALAAVWLVATVIGDGWRSLALRDARLAELGAGAAVGVVMFGVFVLAAEIGRHLSVLAGPIDSLLRKADAGPVAAVLALALVNGIAEEVFFRGVLFSAIPGSGKRAAVLSTVCYVAVTAVSGNTALTLAAAVMGAVFAAGRWWTHRLALPIAVHLVWSTLMILAFPR